MAAVAVAFLALIALRILTAVFDDGFGGAVWTAIVYITTLSWVAGLIMALYILGVRVSIRY